MILGSYTDTIYATPAVLEKFVSDARSRGALLVGVTQTVPQVDLTVATGPSLLPFANPWMTLPVSQVSVQPDDEIEGDQFLTADWQED